jgi:hypothetical protein
VFEALAYLGGVEPKCLVATTRAKIMMKTKI